MKNVVVTFAMLLMISCKKNSDCGFAYSPNNSLIFEMKRQGISVPDSILKRAKLSYVSGGIKKYVADFKTVPDTSRYANMGLMNTRDVGAYGTQTYLIEYNDGSIPDTLFTDYSAATPETGCTELLRQIRFNGQVPPIDTSFKFGINVYVLNK